MFYKYETSMGQKIHNKKVNRFTDIPFTMAVLAEWHPLGMHSNMLKIKMLASKYYVYLCLAF